MPNIGDVIHNPVHGETMRFLETGHDLQVELTVLPQASGPPAHIHPNAAESFHVTSGAILLKAGRERQVLTAGQSLTVSPGTAHTFWNHTNAPAVVITTWKPGLQIADFLDAWFSLARNGRLNDKGMSSPLQTAVLFDAYLDSIAIPKLPLAVQRGVFGLLGRIGRRRGLTTHGGRPSTTNASA